MSLHALPPGVDFAGEVVAGLHQRFPGADGLARVTLYANSAQSLTALRTALIASGPLLLPRLRLVGTLGEGPVTAPLARQLDLGRLISGLVDRHPDLAGGRAVPELARSLADLMAEMQREGLGAQALSGLDVGAHAQHWRDAQAFLAIAADWALRGPPQDMPARQRAAAEAAEHDWKAGLNLPQGPVVVAGSTGSQGATRLFLQAVARLPQGHVILPGWDPDTPPEAMQAATEDHPQARFAPLIAKFGPPGWWTDARPACPARNRLVSLALRPAPVTDRWIAEGPALGPLGPATEGLTLIEAPDPQAEAETLAVIIRDAVGHGRQVTLITPDRVLTRRVVSALDRWRLIPDDSAGVALDLTPPGLFLRQTADLIGRPLAIDGLIALLKHRLTASGAGEHLRHSRDLELYLRRKGPAFPTGAFLRGWAEGDAVPWAAWLADFLDRIVPLARDRAPRPLPDRLAGNLALAEALAAGPEGDPAGLWDGPDGGLARAVMDRLARHARDRHLLTARDYAELLRGELQGQALRRGAEAHPLIRIRGPREARTEAVRDDALILLAGLNEGSWPQAAAADPWLSRQMRAQAGLTSPERAMGLAAHDMQQGLAAREVVLSRAVRDAEADTVPSRWLNRLTNLLTGLPAQGGADALDHMRARGTTWLARAAALAAPAARIAPEPRPAPIPPPPGLRQLSVTEVATLIRDPYALYARRILGLHELDPLRPEPDAAERGTVLHEIMRRFLSPAAAPDTPPEVLQARLLALTDEVLAQDVPWPSIRAFWRARLTGIAPTLMREEAARRLTAEPHLVEKKTEVVLAPLDVRLTARPDRIDRSADGSAVIYDYKSGTAPKDGDIERFDKQLPLTVALAQRGAFRDLGPVQVTGAAYIQLGGEGKTVHRPVAVDLADETWTRLIELLRSYAQGDLGYLSHARAGAWGTYDHLARMGEWTTDATAQPQPVGLP